MSLRTIFKYYWAQAKKYPKSGIAVFVLFILAGVVAQVFSPLVYKKIIDIVSTGSVTGENIQAIFFGCGRWEGLFFFIIFFCIDWEIILMFFFRVMFYGIWQTIPLNASTSILPLFFRIIFPDLWCRNQNGLFGDFRVFLTRYCGKL